MSEVLLHESCSVLLKSLGGRMCLLLLGLMYGHVHRLHAMVLDGPLTIRDPIERERTVFVPVLGNRVELMMVKRRSPIKIYVLIPLGS